MKTKKAISVILCLTLLLGYLLFPAAGEDIPVSEAEDSFISYDVDGDIVTCAVRAGEPVQLDLKFAMRRRGDRLIVGWETEDADTYYYGVQLSDEYGWLPSGSTNLVLQSGETCILHPIWCPVSLGQEEVFSFTNRFENFKVNKFGTYLTPRHYLRLPLNWIAAFMLSPFSVPAALLCGFFMTIWTLNWNGSCCGFASTVLLQHYGKIDLLSKQGVSNVCELEADKETISTLNFYNIHAASVCMLTDHIGLNPGTKEYSSQLRALYDTLVDGKPVYFEQYGDYPHPLRKIFSILFKKLRRSYEGRNMSHGVVLTGAYTDAEGNHILIMYDNNSMNYVNGACDILYINPDFTQIYSPYAAYSNYELKSFSWNEEFDQFDSFKAEGISNPFAWYKLFAQRLPSLWQQITTMIQAG